MQVVPFSHVTCPLQLSVPLHPMPQESASQVMSPLHEPVPAQSTSHPADEGQTMSPWQESVPVQTTTQGMSGGQSTSLLHAAGPLQSMMHTLCALHIPMPASSQAAMQAADGSPASAGGGALESTGPPESMPGEPVSTPVSMPVDASAGPGPPPLSWGPAPS